MWNWENQSKSETDGAIQTTPPVLAGVALDK